jgi:hypothetical protein
MHCHRNLFMLAAISMISPWAWLGRKRGGYPACARGMTANNGSRQAPSADKIFTVKMRVSIARRFRVSDYVFVLTRILTCNTDFDTHYTQSTTALDRLPVRPGDHLLTCSASIDWLCRQRQKHHHCSSAILMMACDRLPARFFLDDQIILQV